MKKFSLEHIIRNIASGNFTPSDEPKITLEHAIKKVVRGESSYAAKDSKPVDEDVGGLAGSGTGGEGKLHAEDGKKKKQMADEEDDEIAGSDDKIDEAVGSIGTDKYQGSQFKSVRSSTPHIKPPGPEHGHSQAPENVSRQRSIAKEKSSMTIQGKVTESVKYKDVQRGYDILRGMLKVQDKVSNLPAVVGSKEVTTSKPSLPAEIETQKTSVPVGKVPDTPPAVAPKMPTPEVKPETKTEVKPEVKTDTKTAVKMQEPTATPTTLTSPKMEVPSQAKTQVVPKTPSAPQTKTATGAKGATPTKPPIPPKTPPTTGVPPEVPAGFMFGGRSVPHDMQYHTLHHVPVKRHVSFAKAHMREETEDRKKIEFVPRKDAGDRKKLEYVGRVKTKQETLGRNAATKTNVIDEGKKLSSVVKKVVKAKTRAESGGLGDGKTKVYDNPPVVINPNLNHPDMNVAEGVLGKAVNKGVGALAAYDVYDALKKGDYTRAGTSAAMLIPNPIGGAAAASGIAGDIATGTETGMKAGEWVAKNVPGAKAAAEKAKEIRAKLGLGSTAYKPEEPSATPEPPPPLSNSDSNKPLSPEPGIQLERKPKVKPLSSVEPIKLK